MQDIFLSIAIMRLQYEILNVPLEDLARSAGLPITALKADAESGNWKQLWPHQSKQLPSISFLDNPNGDVQVEVTLTDLQQAEMDAFIEDTRKRLNIYLVAKDRLLSQYYSKLECDIVSKATEIVASADIGPTGIKAISALYKDLTAGTSLSTLSTLALSSDEGGVPTVVIKDLSGNPRKGK